MADLSRKQWRTVNETDLSPLGRVLLAEMSFHGQAEVHPNDISKAVNIPLNDVEFGMAELQRGQHVQKRGPVYVMGGSHPALPSEPATRPTRAKVEKTLKVPAGE